jgi:ORF6N domain
MGRLETHRHGMSAGWGPSGRWFKSSRPDVDNKFRPVWHHSSMADSTGDKAELQVVAVPAIENRILVVRGRQVMLDEDLAGLYGVETRALVQQVRRNAKRFPADFMFQLSAQEFSDLKSQSVISSGRHGGRRTPPLVFTEQGIAMLSGVLRSDRAIAVNIEIMRAFVELRRAAGCFAELEKQLEQMELEIGARLSEHDEQLSQIFEALRQLIAPPPQAKRPVGFRVREDDK